MSISKVAKAAGVSQATVSRVINDRTGVSLKRAALVRQVIEKLGYVPPPSHRRPGRRNKVQRESTSSMIVVLILDGVYRYSPSILTDHLRGIELGATAHGMSIAIAHAAEPIQLPAIVIHRQTQGVILMGSDASPDVLQCIEGLPTVWFNSHRGLSGNIVLSGNFQIGQLAAQYLLDRGHTHVACLSAMATYPAYPARAESFQYAIQRRGGQVDLFLDHRPQVISGDVDEMDELRHAIFDQVGCLVKTSPRPTGLFVPHDLMTMVVYAALQSHGIQPGRDIDIISCNNETAYRVGLIPRPATIDIGAEIMGRRVVEQLFLQMAQSGDSRPMRVTIEPQLIPGEDQPGARWAIGVPKGH